MLSILYLLLFLAGGVWIARMLLPGRRPLVRLYIGLSLGVLLLMWLPVLWAYGVRFSYLAHGLAAGTLLLLLCVLSWFLRDRTPAKPMNAKEERLALDLMWMVVPLAILSGFLQYTHSIRPMPDGSYYVGQSTYGDLSLHLAVTTSIVNAKFPLENSLMLGATMAYPYLADSIATTMMMLGQSLPTAMAFTGTLMMTLVFMGYGLLVSQLCRKQGARFLAFFLLFLNGGLGFFYTLSGRVENGHVITMWDNLHNVMNGYYQTPTNQPDPNNLRWVNIICDMLIPQRGILGGWTMLMPCLNLLLPPLCQKKRHTFREMLLLGVMAGGMPLLHTHSFLALALTSAGACLYCVVTAARDDVYALPVETLPEDGGAGAESAPFVPEASRSPFLPFAHQLKSPALRAFMPWLVFGATAALLSLPQLINFTFVQATNSNHFLRFQFNWCNNRGNHGLVDPYFWFYIKNIGLPYLLILFALCKRKPKDAKVLPDDIRQNRLIASGAFLIYLIAELIIFQPNEYDNNKLLYVWFLLCLPMAADYAMDIYQRLKGLGGRRMIAAVFLITCFLSAGLTVMRECKSGYQAYSVKDVAVGEYIRENTPEHSVFVTGNQHLNPVSSLAGRTILCSSDSYLYYHGFDTTSRRHEIAAFYEDPAENLWLLSQYDVDYIYVSSYERSANWFQLNEPALEGLFPVIYESQGGEHRIFQVPEELKQ